MLPLRSPNWLSQPQIAQMIVASTPYFVSNAFKVLRWRANAARPLLTRIVGRCDGEVIFERSFEFRLIAVAFHDTGQIPCATKPCGDCCAAEPISTGTVFERGDPSVIACIRLRAHIWCETCGFGAARGLRGCADGTHLGQRRPE